MKTLKVIKIGGNIIDNELTLTNFLAHFSNIKGPKILVHGGGKLATNLAHKMGVAVKMTNGRRITDADTLEIITMVYAGKINKRIVVELQANECNAIGFSGADGNTIECIKRPIKDIDFGYVGDIEKVNNNTLKLLINNSIVPVFCAITHDKKGQLLNTNADTIASELAGSFANEYSVELYYCFDKNGVLKDVHDDESVVEHINKENYQSLIDKRLIADGMLPKLINCFSAIRKNVYKVCIGKPEMLYKEHIKFTTIQL